MLDIKLFEARYKTERDGFTEDFRLRIHRALSWLKKAESFGDTDDDIKFITLWISFNAAYAKEFSNGRTFDKATFIAFIKKICRLDSEKCIQKVVWEDCAVYITTLLNNRYTFQEFWDFYNGKITEKNWKENFHKSRERALHAIKNENTVKLLLIVFTHLDTLRNQLVHGGATYNSKANRKQLNDACHILSKLILEMVNIMIHPDSIDWGKPFYPYVRDEK